MVGKQSFLKKATAFPLETLAHFYHTARHYVSDLLPAFKSYLISCSSAPKCFTPLNSRYLPEHIVFSHLLHLTSLP